MKAVVHERGSLPKRDLLICFVVVSGIAAFGKDPFQRNTSTLGQIERIGNTRLIIMALVGRQVVLRDILARVDDRGPREFSFFPGCPIPGPASHKRDCARENSFNDSYAPRSGHE